MIRLHYEVSYEEGFCAELTVDHFAIVLLKRYHFGINLNKDNLNIIIQAPKNTRFITFGNKKYFKRMGLCTK